MRMRDILAAAGALAASTGSAMAQAADRASAAVGSQSEMFGGSTLLIVALVVALGVGLFLILDDNDDSPDSP